LFYNQKNFLKNFLKERRKMKKKEIFVDVSPEKMQIRNYDPYLTVASTQVG
jgi:hypothetical protein